MRQNQGKPHVSLALQMPGAIEALSAVLAYGEIKYGPANERDWMGYDAEETMDSLMRHAMQVALGNQLDESGLPHIAHILFNAAVLCDHYQRDHGHGSFWDLLPEGSRANLTLRESVDVCDQHPSHHPSGPYLSSPSGDGQRSA